MLSKYLVSKAFGLLILLLPGLCRVCVVQYVEKMALIPSPTPIQVLFPLPVSYHNANPPNSHHFIQSLHLLTLRLPTIRPIILSFNLNNHPLRLLLLPFPLRFTQFLVFVKQLLVGTTIRSSQSIPQRRKLAIVVVEVQMVHCVACSTVDD